MKGLGDPRSRSRALAGPAPPRLPVRPGVDKDFSRQERRRRMENHSSEQWILTAGEGGPGSLWIHPFIQVPFLSQSLAWPV